MVHVQILRSLVNTVALVTYVHQGVIALEAATDLRTALQEHTTMELEQASVHCVPQATTA